MSRGAAIVTGAQRRIGRALALAAADAGYDVLIHHRSAHEEAEAVAEEARALGVKAQTHTADLALPDAAHEIVDAARLALGPLALLVNNASLFEEDSLADLTHDSFEAHMGVNLRAPVLLSQAFARAAERGQIVNILDQRVLDPGPDFFSYTLSKAALWSATRMMARALAPRIRVNAIGPGPTLASIHQGPEDFAAEAAATPLGRPVDPSDIAAALRYLIDAQSVTGQLIAVDSGQHLGGGR